MDDYQKFEMSSGGDGGGCSGGGCLSFIIAIVVVFGVIGLVVSLFK